MQTSLVPRRLDHTSPWSGHETRPHFRAGASEVEDLVPETRKLPRGPGADALWPHLLFSLVTRLLNAMDFGTDSLLLATVSSLHGADQVSNPDTEPDKLQKYETERHLYGDQDSVFGEHDKSLKQFEEAEVRMSVPFDPDPKPDKLQKYEAERHLYSDGGSEWEHEKQFEEAEVSRMSVPFDPDPKPDKLQKYEAERHLYSDQGSEHKHDKSLREFEEAEVLTPVSFRPDAEPDSSNLQGYEAHHYQGSEHERLELHIPLLPTQKVRSCSQASTRARTTCSNIIPNIEMNFVEEPPEMIWCGICAEVLREPQLPTCCGKSHLCVRCIAAIRSKGNSLCPFCRTESFQTISSMDLQNMILNLQIWCPQKEDGCPWFGKIEESVRHSNEDCSFHLLSCPNECGVSEFQRQYLSQHLDECPEQDVNCPFSKAGCNDTIRRRALCIHMETSLHQHLIQVSEKATQLPVQYDNLVQSVDTSYGVSDEQIDGKITALKQQLANIQLVVSSLEVKLQQAQKEFQCLTEEQQENRARILANYDHQQELQSFQYLHEEIHSQLQQLDVPCAESFKTPPVTFTVDKFRERQRVNDKWVSVPFYSHYGGYKMCLTLYPNGNKRGCGSHVSLYIHFMKGEYDNFLHWPFEGHITVLLLNQTGTLMLATKAPCGHHERVICLDTQASIPSRVRVTDAVGSYTSGCGCDEFISHELLGEYLGGDCLKVKVVDILFFPL